MVNNIIWVILIIIVVLLFLFNSPCKGGKEGYDIYGLGWKPPVPPIPGRPYYPQTGMCKQNCRVVAGTGKVVCTTTVDGRPTFACTNVKSKGGETDDYKCHLTRTPRGHLCMEHN